MLKLSQIKQILSKDEINLGAFARGAGLEYHQLRGILKNANPRYLSVELISDYIEKNNLQVFLKAEFKKVDE